MGKRYIPWIDLLLYGGLIVVSIVSVIIALCTDQEWPVEKILVISTIPTAVVVVSLIILLKKLLSRPDFTTRYGVAVWCNDIEKIDNQLMDRAVQFYINEMVVRALVKEDELLSMFQGATVEWRKKPIGMYGIGWAIKEAAGAQQGKSVVVHWKGTIRGSALFHEFHHMVDETILKKPIDYKHEDKKWWAIIDQMRGKCDC